MTLRRVAPDKSPGGVSHCMAAPPRNITAIAIAARVGRLGRVGAPRDHFQKPNLRTI